MTHLHLEEPCGRGSGLYCTQFMWQHTYSETSCRRCHHPFAATSLEMFGIAHPTYFASWMILLLDKTPASLHHLTLQSKVSKAMPSRLTLGFVKSCHSRTNLTRLIPWRRVEFCPASNSTRSPILKKWPTRQVARPSKSAKQCKTQTRKKHKTCIKHHQQSGGSSRRHPGSDPSDGPRPQLEKSTSCRSRCPP